MSDDRQCQVKWEEVWKPHCSTSYEQVCRSEPQQECSTEYREECRTEQRQLCTTEYERLCSTSYEQQCETEYEEECWEETEEQCFHEQACSEPEPVHTYSSEDSRHKRSASDHEEELMLEDEELEAELRAAIDQMSASDLLELSHDFTEEDLNELTEDESSDVTGPGIAVVDGDLNSRTKRGIFLKKFLFKKHLLKKLKNKLKKGLPGPGPLGFLPLIKKKLKKIPGPFGLAPLVIKKALGNPVKKALVKPALAAPLVKVGLGIPVKAGLGIKKKAAGLGVK